MTCTCQYCGAIFTRSASLTKHQTTAKYCLAKQRKNANQEFNCTGCKQIFTRKDALARHEKVCKSNNDKKDDDSVLQIPSGDLVRLLTKLVDRPSARVMNMPPITNEQISEHADNLTIDVIIEGAKGYANYARFYPFKNRLLCTDKARRKLRYKDEDGEIVEDAYGLKLTQRFFQAISERNEALINAEYDLLQKQVQQIAARGTAHSSNITHILEKSIQLQELLAKCREAAQGGENELTKDFVSHLSRMI